MPLLAVAVWLAPAAATAASREECTDSYTQAQKLRKQGKLVAAREQLRICVQHDCPGLIVNDCAQWLDEVQSTLPSVVPLATDEAGANLLDVKVSLDGVPLVNALAGQAIDIDPGTHHFTFERADLATVETDVLVVVGDKNKRVAVTLRKEPVAQGGAPAAQANPEAPARSVAPGDATPADMVPESASDTGGSTFPYRTAGLVVGAAGVVGLGAGTVFGVEAIVKQNDANCPNNTCRPGSNPDSLRTAQTDGNVSTGFFIAGAVLAAAGITTWLLAPSAHATDSAWVRPAPVALASGGGVVLVGGW